MILLFLFFIVILGIGFVLRAKKITGTDHPFQKIFRNKNDR